MTDKAQSSQPDKRSARSMKNLRMKKRFTDLDSESGGSSEEFGSDSPRSVWKSHTEENTKTVQHHQVVKIREEDSHLGEDIGEGFSLSAKEKLDFLKSKFDAFFRENQGFILRGASPLSGKSAIKSFN